MKLEDRMHPPSRAHEGRTCRDLVLPTIGVATFIRDLALKFGVSYTITPTDRWAETATLLAGDEARSGEVQDLLIALKRAGKLSTQDMATLLVNHLREQKLRVRSVEDVAKRG